MKIVITTAIILLYISQDKSSLDRFCLRSKIPCLVGNFKFYDLEISSVRSYCFFFFKLTAI